jgi:putative transcriptional regulator
MNPSNKKEVSKMKNMMFLYYRESKGFSQQEVADELGICKDYVNMIENNRRTPGFFLAKRIADFFGTTVDKLFFYQNSEQIVQNREEMDKNIRKKRRIKNASKILEQYNLNV